MQAYAKGKRVGHGTYGTVYRATHIETGTVVAIKKIRNANGVLSANHTFPPPPPRSRATARARQRHGRRTRTLHARRGVCGHSTRPGSMAKSVVRLPHYA